MLTYMASQTRKPTEVRQREIAEAVLRVIGEQGARSLTAARIAAEVGVTSGALFRHFDSLDAILDAAVDHAAALVEATFPAPDLPAVERLRELATARIQLIGGHRGLAWLLLSDQVYVTLSDSAVTRLRALVKRSRVFLLDAMREGAAEGSIRSDIAPELLLPIFTGTVHALIGAGGVHRSGEEKPDVLGALFKLLSPTHTPG